MAMDDQQRSATIKRTIIISSSVKRRSKQYVRDMHNEIIRRVKEKLTVREKKKATIEKKIHQAIKGGADVTAALECPDKLCESIMKILKNDIVAHYIIHRWYHEDVELDVMWNGKVIGIDTDNKTGDPLTIGIQRVTKRMVR